MSRDETTPTTTTTTTAAAASRPKRERSTRYPGVPLADSLKLCEFIESHGLDGLTAADIAGALGYKNIKTNTFSARLSAARQFGLLTLTGDGYGLTPLARAILHPVDRADLPRLHRQALLEPPLYAELTERLAGKRVPEPAILSNVLYHNHQIIASAKGQAAEAFLDSARFAGALGDDGILRPNPGPEPATSPAATTPTAPPTAGSLVPTVGPGLGGGPDPLAHPKGREAPRGGVRIDLQLWDEDQGKAIRLRAPEAITRASYERFLQAFRLLVRVEDGSGAGKPEAR